MRIYITGLNGFLGGQLAASLAKAGHPVTGSSRTSSAVPGATVWSLEESPDPARFAGIDLVVHTAYDGTPGARHRNVDGTLALANAARRAGVRRQILLSALSAGTDPGSEFAWSKAALEHVFLERDTVVRPGLVVGKGGLFARIARIAAECSILPRPSGDVALLGLADFLTAMTALVGRPDAREINLFERRMPMDDLVRRLGRARVVSRAAWTLCFWLRRPSASDVDLLRGLGSGTRESHLPEFVSAPASLEETLREALPPRGAPDTIHSP